MANVREVKGRPGWWEVRVYVGVDPETRKSRYKSHKFQAKSRRMADREAAKFVGEVYSKPKAAAKGSRITINALLDRYLEHCITVRKLEPSTTEGYRKAASKIRERIGDCTIQQVCDHPEIIDRFTQSLAAEEKGSTAMRRYRLLTGAFNQAVRWKYIMVSPMAATTAPRELQPEHVIPTKAEVNQILALAAQRDPAVAIALRLAAALGVRRGELAALRWSDFDGNIVTIQRSIGIAHGEEYVKPTKTNKVRRLSIGPGTMAELAKWRAHLEERAAWAETELMPDGYVLSDAMDCSEHWHLDRISKRFRRLSDKIGLDATLHGLRHWHASELLDLGESPIAVAARLGHTPTMTMKTYGHLLRPDGRGAEGVDRLLASDVDADLQDAVDLGS